MTTTAKPFRLLMACLTLVGLPCLASHVPLPYDHTNPVFYDNDGTVDIYTYHYFMALASAGSIKLVGMSSSCSFPNGTESEARKSMSSPYNYAIAGGWYSIQIRQLRDLVVTARNSGFENIPDVLDGAREPLIQPASGEIGDTVPVDSPATRQIVKLAKAATREKPLVIVTGGQLTSIASAYLLDPSITERVIAVVAGGFGTAAMDDYNGTEDPWAAAIVVEKFRAVMFPYLENFSANAHVYADQLRGELPDSPLRQQMIQEANQEVGAPDGDPHQDQDGVSAYALMAPDFAVSAKRVSFDRMFNRDGPHGGNYPVYRDDPNGNVLVITQEDQGVANAEWWRAMKNPANYHLPAAPTNLRAIKESETTIVLNWTDNSDNESGFKIERAADSAFQHELSTLR